MGELHPHEWKPESLLLTVVQESHGPEIVGRRSRRRLRALCLFHSIDFYISPFQLFLSKGYRCPGRVVN